MKDFVKSIFGNRKGFALPEILIVIAIISILLTIVAAGVVRIVHVEGHERAILETWSDGVVQEVLGPKKYIRFVPTEDFIKYDTRVQSFVQNNTPTAKGEISSGREQDRYEIQVGTGAQTLFVSHILRWHYNIDKLLTVHKEVRNDPEYMEEKVIRPNLMRVVKDKATINEALDIYSGKGLVQLQEDIQKTLETLPEFTERGIVVDGYVIERIDLDKAYAKEIADKQLAIQKALRQKEEEKSNLATAKAADAFAQIEKNKQVVLAQQNKEVGILAKEQSKQERILEAEAQKREQTLEGEGKRDADIAKAKGILARGMAEAKVEEAKRNAMYAGEAGHRRATVEIATARVSMFKNLKSVLPEKVALTLIDETLSKDIKSMNLPMDAVQ